MSDYIKREAAIAAAFSANGIGNSEYRNVCDIAERLRLIPAADVVERNQWIPVTERLPEYCRNVIVTDGEYVSMGWLDNYRDRNGTVYIIWYAPNSSVNESHISHWMPLPEPPESEEE